MLAVLSRCRIRGYKSSQASDFFCDARFCFDVVERISPHECMNERMEKIGVRDSRAPYIVSMRTPPSHLCVTQNKALLSSVSAIVYVDTERKVEHARAWRWSQNALPPCWTRPGLLTSFPSSKSTFSQPFKDKSISEVVRIGRRYNHLSSE